MPDNSKHITRDLKSTLAQSDPEDEITEEEFNEALSRSREDTTPGLDKVPYLDNKILTKEE